MATTYAEGIVFYILGQYATGMEDLSYDQTHNPLVVSAGLTRGIVAWELCSLSNSRG